jgi:hypothetical protein
LARRAEVCRRSFPPDQLGEVGGHARQPLLEVGTGAFEELLALR